MPSRCALGCEPNGTPLHRFPNPDKFPEQFKSWVNIEGGNWQSPENFLQYRNKRICDIHFGKQDRNRNNRLNAEAVPSLHLPMRCCKEHNKDPVSQLSSVKIQPIESNLEKVPVQTKPTTSTVDDKSDSLSEINNQIGMSSKLAINVTNVSWAVKNNICDEHNYSSRDESTPKIDVVGPSFDDVKSDLPRATSSTANDNDYCPKPRSARSAVVGPSAVDVTSDLPCAVTNSTANEHNYCARPGSVRKGKKTTMPYYITKQLKDSMRQVKNLKREIVRLKKRGLSFKSRLENVHKISENMAFQMVTKDMTRVGKLFTKMQQTQSAKKPKGRRFSIEQKIIALSYYKRSPKLYPLLAKDFVLPSKKSLKMLLSTVQLKTGINKIIFEKIEKTVKGMNKEELLCTLIFDEMSITPQINYDAAKDELKGLSSQKNIADHVLVFMVKGIKANFKQPVAYYFTNNLNKNALKQILLEVIENVQATGLEILATVCDQCTVNVSVINSLIDDTRSQYLQKGLECKYRHFQVNKKIIIPLYDVPHLLKGLRNNLLTKDLVYYDERNNKKIVKWEYFEMLYVADKSYGELRVAQKLTEEHVIKDKIKKMKVKTAAQVFSHSVAVATEHLSARGDLPKECRDLIPLVLLIDQLFDSLNSSTFHIPNGKIYKGCVKKKTPHHLLWQKAIKMLNTVKFITKTTIGNKVRFTEKNVPSVQNFIKTIEGVQRLWKTLNEKFSIDSLLTRNLNQDPVENFFGNIRSYGVRNVAPDCIAFEGAYKSLLLNNYSTPHSIHGNCEEDKNDCLETLDFFLTEKPRPNVSKNNEEIVINPEIIIDNEIIKDKGQSSYVCGWVLTKCLKNVIKGCKICKKDVLMENQTDDKINDLIRRKEYNSHKKWLCYPNQNILRVFQDIQKITCNFLKRDVPESGLRNILKMLCAILVNYPFSCNTHKDKLKAYFEDITTKVLIYSWCRSINRILTGKIVNSDNDDQLKLAAQAYCNKYKNKSRK